MKFKIGDVFRFRVNNEYAKSTEKIKILGFTKGSKDFFETSPTTSGYTSFYSGYLDQLAIDYYGNTGCKFCSRTNLVV